MSELGGVPVNVREQIGFFRVRRHAASGTAEIPYPHSLLHPPDVNRPNAGPIPNHPKSQHQAESESLFHVPYLHALLESKPLFRSRIIEGSVWGVNGKGGGRERERWQGL